MKSITGSLLTSLAASIVLAGCSGTQTNPVANYSNLNNSVPPSQETVSHDADYEATCVLCLTGEDNLNFVEGEATSYLITARLRTGATINLAAKDLPQGAHFGVATDQAPGTYRLSWKPTLDTLGEDEPFRNLKFEIEIAIVSAPDSSSAQLLKEIGSERTLVMSLIQSRKQPILDAPVVSKSEVTVGDKVTFSMSVTDTEALNGQKPSLWMREDDGSHESAKISNVHEFVTLDAQPTVSSDGKFVFTGTLDTTGMKLPAGAQSAYARVQFQATSPNDLVSPDKTLEIKVDAAAPAPAVPVSAPSASPSPTATPSASNSNSNNVPNIVPKPRPSQGGKS